MRTSIQRCCISTLLLFLVSLYGCSRPHDAADEPVVDQASDAASKLTDTAATKAAIDAATAQLRRGFETGQWDSAAAVLTEDHFNMPPNAPPISGRAKWLASSKATMVGGQWTTVTTPELRVYGDSLTIDRGSYVNSFVPAPGAPETFRPLSDTGKYVWIWKRTAAGWQISQAIWNSNSPPTP